MLIGMQVDGLTMGTGALAHRFAGQDAVLANAVSESVGTLSVGKLLWQCIVWCLSDAIPILCTLCKQPLSLT